MNITKEGEDLIKSELLKSELEKISKELFGHTKPLTGEEAELLEITFKKQLKKNKYTI